MPETTSPSAASAIVALLDFDIAEQLQKRERLGGWRHVRLWKRPARISVVLLLWLCAVSPVDAAQSSTARARAARRFNGRPTLAPRDESAKDSQLHALLQLLRSVVVGRDTATLLRVVDPGITLDFGGSDGVENLKKTLNHPESANEFWREFAIVLNMGGTFDGPDKFWTPYVFSPSDMLDRFGDLVVTARGVRLRAKPSHGARTVGSLDYDIVTEVEPQERVDGWRHVRLWNGQTGYVASEYVRSPIDYRAWFERTKDGWRLMGFLAGD